MLLLRNGCALELYEMLLSDVRQEGQQIKGQPVPVGGD